MNAKVDFRRKMPGGSDIPTCRYLFSEKCQQERFIFAVNNESQVTEFMRYKVSHDEVDKRVSSALVSKTRFSVM